MIIAIVFLLLQLALVYLYWRTSRNLLRLIPEYSLLAMEYFPVSTFEMREQSPPELYRLVVSRSKTEKVLQHNPIQLRLMVSPVSKNNPLLFETINSYLIRVHDTQPDLHWLLQTTDRLIQSAVAYRKNLPVLPALASVLLGLMVPMAYWESFAVQWTLIQGIFLTVLLVVCETYVASLFEKQKNGLFTFFQNELQVPVIHGLPEQTAKLNITVQQLADLLDGKLAKLHNAYEGQLEKLITVQQEQITAINRETALLEQLKNTDLVQIARINATVFTGLQQTMTDFDKFSGLASSLGGLLESMHTLTAQVNTGVENIVDISRLAATISETVQTNTQLQQFLTGNLRFLEDYSGMIREMTGGFHYELSKSFESLRDYLLKQSESLYRITVSEQVKLQEVISTGRSRFEQLDLLKPLAEDTQQLLLHQQQSLLVFQQISEQLALLRDETRLLRQTMENRKGFFWK